MAGSRLLKLPGEIREAIYHEVLCSVNNKYHAVDQHNKYVFDLNLLLTCQQIYQEASTVFRRDNIFVAIETPWPATQQHVMMDGYVPIVIKDVAAQRFTHAHLTVVIGTPIPVQIGQPMQRFVILVDDLQMFTEMWYYTDLTHTGMNAHLKMTLKLRDPYSKDFEQKTIPKAIQRKLLEPFGVVKGLHEVEVQGEHYDSVEKAMRTQMKVPYPKVEKCLEEATKLKDAGNEALKNGKYHEALKSYRESFSHLFIVVDRRRRSIWGDEYFQKQCQGGQFDGENAQLLRLVLRIRLVSNTIMAHLKLEDYEEAVFWGMRTINLLQNSLDPGGAILGFPAAPETGKIYYRTGMAFKALGDKMKARELLRMAVKYLPNDPIVQKDYTALAPQLG
ncbi:hypothetical protein BJ878DRAFT_515659 [Calycina marina]|uniref:Uncharacterized protein n=1 Tax=Calycina marina TaxID=1763456 RepID=A0A9P8CD70_9HELO|nr:hypothetical protein BJ878DRAFT_515659 [Calycina marina]